ncbi:MAG: type IV pilus assembly protein PilM [Verrucomicrobiota bacterium]
MLNSKSFLAADFGAGSLKMAEFEPNEAGGLRLRQYGVKPLGLEGSQEATRESAILHAIQLLLSEKHFGSKQINVCAPGFHVFSKFVKLPPVDTAKVAQIIEYEARQNVPFPLEEVVWDYQILGTTATGELEVLLVAIKTEVVEGLFRASEGAGLRLKLVDVSPAALCNAFRYNYGDLEGCTMLLDIGAKTSNLLFFEKGKVYSRSINIGANSITQDFANESKLTFPEADQLKIEQGFVSLGGAYEEPENPQQAAISKIARQVMTRLHIQVNQTKQFYRGQQGGSEPQRLFLSGGASIMPYTAQFFSEKLNLPVEYFNPFRNIQIDPSVDLEELSKTAHSFGEVVGLGLRDLAHCPVELNLMPKSSIQRQQFGQKKPYIIASVFAIVLVVFAIGWFESQVAAIKAQELEKIKTQVEPLRVKEGTLRTALAERDKLKREADQMMGLVDDRFYWAGVLVELRRIFVETEANAKTNLNTEVGLWVEIFAPELPAGGAYTPSVGSPDMAPPGAYPPELGGFENGPRRGMMPMPMAGGPTPGQPAASGTGTGNEISILNFVCKGVNLDRISPTANKEVAYTLEAEIKKSPFFIDQPVLGDIKIEPTTPLVFTFNLTIKLKRPFKL